MEDNQINGQKNKKEAYCPNMFFDNSIISIGEFKTLDDAMNFPIKRFGILIEVKIINSNPINHKGIDF